VAIKAITKKIIIFDMDTIDLLSYSLIK
jgi:hypothetical protein